MTPVDLSVADLECFLKMYRVDFVQKFVVNLILEVLVRTLRPLNLLTSSFLGKCNILVTYELSEI